MIFFLLLFWALFGHAVLWTAFVNRLHASAVPYRAVNALSYAALAAVTAMPLVMAARMWRTGAMADLRFGGSLNVLFNLPFVWLFYLSICWIAAAAGLVGWVVRRFGRRSPEVLLGCDCRSVCLTNSSKNPSQVRLGEDYNHHPLLALPGNQSLRIDVVERSLVIERLHPRLDGLSIVHLSDLHMSGKVGKGYFEEVVALSNESPPDLVAITGDLVDKSRYIDWIPDTLGKLQSRCGVYYILGNHDLRVDVKRLRETLKDAGLTDLGGRWRQIRVDEDFNLLRRESGGQAQNGYSIVLAGNELPWFVPAADMRGAPARSPDSQPLRILLSHSPDQLDWAVAADFDLMLAGHLHGGQFRVPLVGPVLSPSRKGVKYSAGVYYSRPTVLHVSRGVSAEWPVRFNCEPELARLVLRREA